MYELRGFFPRDASKLQPEWIVSMLEPRAFFPRGTLLNKAANRMDCFHSGAAWILSTWRFRAELPSATVSQNSTLLLGCAPIA